MGVNYMFTLHVDGNVIVHVLIICLHCMWNECNCTGVNNMFTLHVDGNVIVRVLMICLHCMWMGM